MDAQLALIIWVPFSALVFTLARPVTAVVVVLLGGLLLLPSAAALDFRGFPELDKHRISVLAAMLGCAVFAPRTLRRPPASLLLLAGLLTAGCFLTVATNPEPVFHGPVALSSLRPWDGVNLAAAVILDLMVPFYLGWTLFQRPRDLHRLLTLMVLAACAYSLLMLYEIRMSPQLHRIVYGYSPFHFLGARRGHGYRPFVFMGTGLDLALFIACCCTAAVTLWRAGSRTIQFLSTRASPLRVPTQVVLLYLLAILVATKSLAAIVYGSAAALVIGFARSRWAMRCAIVLALMVATYPLLRVMDVFPTTSLVRVAKQFDEVRGQSLAFRFGNEDRLLARAMEKPWFGWGGYNRNRVFDEISGRDISITDGYWIIKLGIGGLLSWAGSFALLLTPVFLAALRLRLFATASQRALITGVTWIVVINAVDLLPNTSPNALMFLTAGALAAVATNQRRATSRTRLSARRRRASTRKADTPLVYDSEADSKARTIASATRLPPSGVTCMSGGDT